MMTYPPHEAVAGAPVDADVHQGHPEPEPVPVPEPEPPQPIPPPEPIPAPEPPHVTAPARPHLNQPTMSHAAQSAMPDITEPTAPYAVQPTAPYPTGPTASHAAQPTAPPSTDPTVSIAATEAGPSDAGPSDAGFFDTGAPTAEVGWPPLGAYPGEPGHPGPDPGPVPDPPQPPVADQQTTTMPALADQTEQIETHWHQPPPAEPWHARHERPGEWRYQPPEHLALEHSPPAEVESGVQDRQIEAGHPPWEVPLLRMEQGPSRRRRTRLWVSLALVVTLLLCGGGATSAFLLLRNTDTGNGAPDPATAVDRFMTAVYTQQDATAADEVVCREARDKRKLTARVAQIKNYAAEYDGPTFRWTDPAVAGQTDERATVSVQLTMATEDEKQAQQELTFTVVHKSGWLVCDITG